MALVASVGGFVGLPPIEAYGASKAPLLALGKGCRIALARFGIVVTTVAPAPVDTPMTRGDPYRLPFTLSAEAAARRIAAAEEAEEAGGSLAVFPWPWACLFWLLSRMPRSVYGALAGRLNTVAL